MEEVFLNSVVMKKYISEMIFTFIFVLVVLGVTDDKKGTPVMCGLAIGLTYRLYPYHRNFCKSCP